MFDLSSKVIVITGGGSGIGKAISCAAAALGAVAVIADINADAAKTLAEELTALNLRATAIETDVSRSGSVENLVNRTVKDFGRLDVIVNNAGILGDAEIVDIRDEDWKRFNSVNYDGVFYCCREAVRVMKKQGCGKIINIASVGGKLAFPYAGVHYCAAKGAVMALTRQLALQVAQYGIQVNAVAPGTTQTEMVKHRSPEKLSYICDRIPMGRLANPEEIAAPVIFLASDAAGFITGETFDANGGLYMS